MRVMRTDNAILFSMRRAVIQQALLSRAHLLLAAGNYVVLYTSYITAHITCLVLPCSLYAFVCV